MNKSSEMGSVSNTILPCAGCKFMRRRCTNDCILVPYFPAKEPEKFLAVHRVFGTSNVCKMLQKIPMENRGDAVTSLVYEANARLRDPVYGCVGIISSLQSQVSCLQDEVAMVLAEAMKLRAQLSEVLSLWSFEDTHKMEAAAAHQFCDDSGAPLASYLATHGKGF